MSYSNNNYNAEYLPNKIHKTPKCIPLQLAAVSKWIISSHFLPTCRTVGTISIFSPAMQHNFPLHQPYWYSTGGYGVLYMQYGRWESIGSFMTCKMMKVLDRAYQDKKRNQFVKILGLYSLSLWKSYRKILGLETARHSGSDFFNCSEIWQAPRQQRCREFIAIRPL